jgi:hypothetical protein
MSANVAPASRHLARSYDASLAQSADAIVLVVVEPPVETVVVLVDPATIRMSAHE